MQTLLISECRKLIRILIIALFLSSIFGCTTTALMARCESWIYQGLSDDSPHGKYRIETTIYGCGAKCHCLNDGRLVSCESGRKSVCFNRCAKYWEVECTGWVDVPVYVDFITREEVKK